MNDDFVSFQGAICDGNMPESIESGAKKHINPLVLKII